MADQQPQIPAPRLDSDEQAWLDTWLIEHPAEAGQGLAAALSVHKLHLIGGCS